MNWLETLRQDVRFGARMLRKNLGFTFIVILTLAAGIGANTAIFSIVYAVLLRPLPFHDPHQLVFVWETDANRSVQRGVAAPAEFLDWQEQSRSFSSMAAWRSWTSDVRGHDEPAHVLSAQVSYNFFDMLGTKAALGRTFVADDGQPGHGQVVVLSHALWRERFGADPTLIGQSIEVQDKAYTVIGVLPPGFTVFGTSKRYDVWIPFTWDRTQLNREEHSVIAFARMRPGVTLAQAQAEMTAINWRLRKAYPGPDELLGIRVQDLQEDIVGSLRPGLLLLMGAVSLVLLIGCANVANLLLARSAGREREIATRAILGAGRLRLVRQLITESLLLAVISGALGVLLAFLGTRLLLVFQPSGGFGELPHREWIGVNPPVLLFTLGASLITGILFGLAPALHVARTDLQESMKEGGKGSTSRRGKWIRSTLVVAELAISLMLLAAAGLLIQSFSRLMGESVGFNSHGVLTLETWLPPAHYPTSAQAAAFYQQSLEHIAAVPGVSTVGAINFLPLSGWQDFTDFDIEGRPAPRAGEEFTSQYRVVDEKYFQTLQIPLLEGRSFSPGDGAHAPGVAIVSELLAHRYWPNQNPIGQRIRLHLEAAGPWRPDPRGDWLTIVGVVGDIREWEWSDPHVPELYLPYLQNPSHLMRFTIRAAGDPAALAPAVRQAIWRVDKNQPIAEVKTMDQFLSEALAQRRLNMSLLVGFAGLGLLLAAVGIYGVMSYSVTQRSHEIGIRMALGAHPRNVLRLLLGQGLRLTVSGIIVGVVASLLFARWLSSLLFGVKPTDPLTLAVVAVILGLVAFVACYVPARRATLVDPLTALRYE